jgi:HAD superfamily hydrolase (TIGR01490 family)
MAVFAIDNTLLHGSVMSSFRRALARAKTPSARQLVLGKLPHTQSLRDCESPAGPVDREIATALGCVRGYEAESVRNFADVWVSDVLEGRGNRMLQGAVQDLRASGHVILLASACPQEIASAIGAKLGGDAAIGTEMEIRDGVYTGRRAGPVMRGSAKAHRVLALMDQQGIDPEQTWAFSSSVDDTPLLNAVGFPVVVNPGRRLRRVASERGWALMQGR